MRVLLCGGGTAGHVMPAIAIAEIIEKSFKGSTVAFAGRQGGDENKAYKARDGLSVDHSQASAWTRVSSQSETESGLSTIVSPQCGQE